MTLAAEDGKFILQKLNIHLSLPYHFLLHYLDCELTARVPMLAPQDFTEGSLAKLVSELVLFLDVFYELELLVVVHAESTPHLHGALGLQLIWCELNRLTRLSRPLLHRAELVLPLCQGEGCWRPQATSVSERLEQLRILPVFTSISLPSIGRHEVHLLIIINLVLIIEP